MLIELNQVIPEPIPKEMIERSEVWETQLKIEPKSFTLISAHSGKGKSTLLHLLYGLRKDFSGEVIMDGENIQKQTSSGWTSLRSTQIALLFQELKLFPKLCARENIELIPQINHNVPSGLEMAKQLGMEGISYQTSGNPVFRTASTDCLDPNFTQALQVTSFGRTLQSP
jgi:putative ABC transport system ATP-binding protein